MSVAPQTPHSLIDRVRVGQASEEDWRRLVEHYWDWVVWLLGRWLRSNDVAQLEEPCQRVFVKLWKRLPSNPGEFPPGYFHRWLFVVARNELRSWLREQPRMAEPMMEELIGSEEMTPELEREHRVHLVRKAWNIMLAEAPTDDWRYLAFEAVTLREEPTAEVATKFQTSVGNIHQIRSRLMKELRRRITEVAGPDFLEILSGGDLAPR